MTLTDYECGTCGSTTLHVELYGHGGWSAACGAGHPWVSVPGEDVTIMFTAERIA